MSKKKNTKATKNVQSRLVDVNQLENPKSRIEEYLHFINNTGKIVDINQLPKPQSRVEWLLLYLCENIGNIGGGGGQPFNGVVRVTYEAQTKELVVEQSNGLINRLDLGDLNTKINNIAPVNGNINLGLDKVGDTVNLTVDGQPIANFDLTDYVKTWKDLEYAEEYQYANLLEYNKKETGFSYRGSGDTWIKEADWSTAFVDVEEGKTYTVFRRNQDSNRFVFTNSIGGAKLDAVTANTGWDSNGFNGRGFKVPAGKNITKVAIMFQHNSNTINDIMMLEEEIRDVDGFIPFADKNKIQVGKEVSLGFNNSNSNLKSTTVESAIKEVNEKIKGSDLPLTDCEVINLFNDKQMVLGRRYDNAGAIVADRYYATYTHPCSAGDTITIAKYYGDDNICVYLTEDNQKVQAGTLNLHTRNDIKHYQATVPNEPTIAKIGFNIKTTLNATQVMIYEGHNYLPSGTQFTPYLSEKILNGNSIIHHFDNTNTNLSSTNTRNALEELSLAKVDKHITTFNRHRHYRDFSAKYYRIPSLLATNSGTLLSFADIRYNTANDQSFIDIGVSRSVDDGKVWNNSIAMTNDRFDMDRSRVMDSTSVVTPNGKIIVLAGGWREGSSNWTQSTDTPTVGWNPYIVTSDNDGVSWSDKVSLNGINNQPINTVAWLGGVGTGIVKKKGNNIGRIILPIQICVRDANRNVVKAGCIYSNDDGVTWTMSNGFAPNGTSENMIAEIGNGDLIMIARIDNRGSKGAYISTDGGDNWTEYTPLHGKFTHGTPSCQGSWITLELNGQTIGLLSHPKNTVGTYQRDNITIYMYNFDNPTQGITELYTVYPYLGNASGAGYSSLCYYKNIHNVYKLAIAFETNGNIEFKDISEVLDIINGNRVTNEISELYERKLDGISPSVANDLTVENLKITGSPITISRTNVGVSVANSKTMAGDKGASVQPNTKISKIQIGVEGYTEGELVTGVEVYAVNKLNDKIIERVINNGTGFAKISKSTGENVLYVDVSVNKSYTDEVYFIAGLRKNGNKGLRLGGTLATGIAFDKQTEDEELTPGTTIQVVTRKIPNTVIFGEVDMAQVVIDATLNNANGIDFKRADGTTKTINIPTTGGGTGTVSSINGVNPQANGDVILTSQITQAVGQDIVLRVGNQNFATLACMTDQEATTIIDGFTL